MRNKHIIFIGILLRLSTLQAQTEPENVSTNNSAAPNSPAETNAAQPEPRWTTYYSSTNEYASYLESNFTYESAVALPDSLQTRLLDFFRTDYRATYNIFKLKTTDEVAIYDMVDKIYETQELFSVFHEYLEILSELEGMGSHILIHDVSFKKIDVKRYKKNILTVEAVWSVHGTVRHITHDHEQQNANCVQFKIQVTDPTELKIMSSKVMSIDRFDLYK
jgi:hypothetical protein